MKEITSTEVLGELRNLRQALSVLFRCVEGPPRSHVFNAPYLSDGEKGIYQVVGFAAEMHHPDDEEKYGLALVNSMAFIFQELWNRGARTLAWRREFELNIASGGDRVPDLIRINCRICAFDANGVRVSVGEWEWTDGTPASILTREQLEEGKP